MNSSIHQSTWPHTAVMCWRTKPDVQLRPIASPHSLSDIAALSSNCVVLVTKPALQKKTKNTDANKG